MQPFVVTAKQRSGSIFFESVLNSHPRIHCHGEILHGRNRESKLDYFYRFWLDRVRQDGAVISFMGMVTTFDDYLGHLFDPSRGNQAVGVDIKYDQFAHIPYSTFFLKKHHVKVIHLIRRNLLKTFTSKRLNDHKKELSRRAHGTSKVPPAMITFDDLEQLVPELDKRTAEIEAQQRMLAGEFETLEIFYEDLCADMGHECQSIVTPVLDDIYTFLNISDRRYDLQTSLRKTNSDRLADLITNYDEVAEALIDTQYAHFLD